MSKKKKKKDKLEQYPKNVQEKIISTSKKMAEYADIAYNYGIFVGKRKEDVERAVEIVKKNAKRLRKGKLDKVLTEEGIESEFGDIDY